MKYNTGFTLVELIIVMAIVAILSIVSVPIYQIYIERARETELNTNIPAIIKAQRFHVMEYGQFADNLLDLGFQINGIEKTYNGRKGIRTKNYFYSTWQESDEDLYTCGWIYVYRNKGNNVGVRFGIRMFYVKVPEWYFYKDNVKKQYIKVKSYHG